MSTISKKRVVQAMLLLSFQAGAQGFQHIYPTTYDRQVYDVTSTADGGYMLVGLANSANAADCDLYVMRTNNAGALVWDTVYAGSRTEEAHSIEATDDGNFIIAGYTRSKGGGDQDMWLLKVNQQGRLLKEAVVGTSSNEEAMKIIRAHEGGFLVLGSKSVGSADSKIMLVKIDENLNVAWEKFYEGGAAKDLGRSIRKTPDNGYLIAGQTTSKGAGEFDAYLVKIDADYNFVWDKAIGSYLSQDGIDLEVNTDGTFVLLIRDSLSGPASSDGNINIVAYKANSDGSEIWTRTFGGDEKDTPKSIRRVGAGYLIGSITRSGLPAPNMWIFHIDENGIIDWGHTFGDYYEHDHCHIAKPDGQGNIIAAGHQQKPMKKIYFLRLDMQGYVGVNEEQLSGADLFPNPSSGSFRIEAVNKQMTIENVRVSDLLGRDVKFTRTGDGAISLSEQRAGVYIVNMDTPTGVLTKRIVVKEQ